MADEEQQVSIKVWDGPVRVVHWAMVLLFVVQVVSGKMGGDMMPLHVFSGYAMIVLVVFRLIWGFVGSTHARFASFIAGPAATLRFARRLFSRQAVPQVGHNPLGGWSVIAMLLSLALQVASGLFANDGAAVEGPLASLVSFEVSTVLSEFHRWNLKLLLVLSAIHVGAVFFHLFVKRDNVLGAMFTGVRRVPPSVVRERRVALRDSPRRRAASREAESAYFPGPWRGVWVLAVTLALVYLLVR
ncbi:cytochrome b/b6 domain-containing protein [Usitatibacter palustris]|uniref:Cytochrome b561 bacterial/Ni-hydrogenase domain-containing protein n=1 Tax=Usitatibacter palustris TaxID=2732487 RepID=A0A6M4H352_9PROT|nr:cytochrome b/b6 domain-containing protein [Usitatibacter palustris]QJR13956.1 hypothetical protein DSM104440_00748 [Usitatibacter palustris]